MIDVLRIALSHRDAERGLFHSRLHPTLGNALNAIRADPTRDWLLDTLMAGLSHSSFAGTFTNAFGDSPGD
ncbi:hypothetical protein [Duganella sp. HH101]|uniref:hypothetical protein n=1 Tax=Duganella sp. HH101 TaxID=1781066 RepID=UPI00087453E0|nr:hypothetical protein [Duganella sp. HH101]